VFPTLECILDRGLAAKIIERSVEVFPPDGILFRQEQNGDCIYFVKWGEVALTMLAGEKEIRLRAGKGSLLGLSALFGHQPYTMTAKASWDAEIFRLSAPTFTELVDSEPGMKEIVLQILAGEVRAIRQAFSQLM
jgi:CRP-like cAMP-binding protein